MFCHRILLLWRTITHSFCRKLGAKRLNIKKQDCPFRKVRIGQSSADLWKRHSYLINRWLCFINPVQPEKVFFIWFVQRAVISSLHPHLSFRLKKGLAVTHSILLSRVDRTEFVIVHSHKHVIRYIFSCHIVRCNHLLVLSVLHRTVIIYNYFLIRLLWGWRFQPLGCWLNVALSYRGFAIYCPYLSSKILFVQ